MADHSREVRTPDYSLADTMALDDPAQYRALFEPTRAEIVSLLLQRAATTSELAEVLGKPKGTVGHHLKVLADAGLVTVVRTKRVRALEAKYYGRTARVFWYDRAHDAVGQEERVLSATVAGVRTALERDAFANVNVRYARITTDRLEAWNERMHELIAEFTAEEPAGDVTYALAFALYATDRPALPPADSAE